MSTASGDASTVIGHVTEAAGPVIVVNQDGEQRILETGDTVYLNEQVITQRGAFVSIRLLDNRIITLQGESSLMLDESLRSAPVVNLEEEQASSLDVQDEEKTIAEIVQGADPVDVSSASAAGGESESSQSDSSSQDNPESDGFSLFSELPLVEREQKSENSTEENYESPLLVLPDEDKSESSSYNVIDNYIPVALSSRMTGSADGSNLDGQLRALDGNSGETLTFYLLSGPEKGSITLTKDGLFKFDPGSDFRSLAEGDQDSVSFTFEVRDAQGNYSQSTVDISIIGVNDAPEVSQSIESSLDQNSGPLTINLLEHASDIDNGDSLYVSRIQLQSGNESGVSLSLTGNELVIDPQAYKYLAEGEQEILTYEYRVTDSQGAYVIQTAEIVIDGQNDLPTVSSAVVFQGDQNAGSFSVNLLDGARDIDLSDTLNVVSLQLEAGDPRGVTFDSETNTLEVDSSAYAGLAEGETETVEYSYQIDDGQGGQVEQTASVEIEGINDAPTSLDNQVTINEDAPYTFSLADFPYSDVDNNDALEYVQISTLPTEGLLFLSGLPALAGQDISRADIENGLLIFTPEDNASGDDYSSFTFRVSDGDLLSAEQTFSIDVVPINDAPETVNTSATVDEDTPYIFAASDFIFTDVDVDVGDEFAGIQIAQLPVAGSLLFNGSTAVIGQDISKQDLLAGRLKFEPALNENGNQYASFEFKVSDGELLSEIASFEINVTPINDAPIVSADIDQTTDEDINLVLTEAELLANASDIDGDTLSVNNLRISSGQVSVTDNGDSTWTITPDANWSGSAELLFDVTDGTVTVGSQINLAVDPVADEPIVTLGGNTVGSASFTGSNTALLADSSGPHSFVAGAGEELVYDTGIDPAATDMTVSFWMRWDGTQQVMPVSFATYDIWISNDAIGFNNWNNNIYGSTLDNLQLADGSSGLANEWHHVVATFNDGDASQNTLRIDGITQSMSDEGSGTTSPSANANIHQTLYFGGGSSNAASYQFIGDIDGIKVFEGTMTDAEAQSLYETEAGLVDYHPGIGSIAALEVSAIEDTDFSLDLGVTVTDSDGSESLDVSLGGIPSGFAITDGSNIVTSDGNDIDVTGWNLGNLTFSPAANYNSDFTIAVTATSTESIGGDTSSITRNINVQMQAVNDAAIIDGDDSGSITEDVAPILDVSGSLTVSDVDDGESAFTAETVAGSYGDLSISSDGHWTYQADNSQSNIQSLGNGETATDSLSVRSVDGTVHNIVINITGTNDAAQITGASTATITEDVAVNAGNQLLASGQLQVTDADSGEAFFNSGVVSGSYGDLNIDSSGNWVYTADNTQDAIQSLGAGEQLAETLTVTTLDGSSQNITITINGSNDVAQISGVNAGDVTEDATAQLTTSGQLDVTDIDTGEDEFTVQSQSGVYGDINIDADGNWTYSADNSQAVIQELDDGETLTDSFTVNSADGTSETIEITLHGENDAPVVDNPVADQTVAEEQLFSFQIPANTFSDIDGDNLTYSAVLSNGSPLPGWLSFDSAIQTFSGTPDDPDLGTLNVRVMASDGTTATAAEFSLDVTPVNDPPELLSGSFAIEENSGNGSVLGVAPTNDVDSSALTYSLVDDASGRFVINSSTGEITVADGTGLNYEQDTDHTITVQVSDGQFTDTQSYTVSVLNKAEAPVISSDVEETGTDDSGIMSINLLENASAVESGETLSVNSLSLIEGDDTGITFNGTTMAIDASEYGYLPDGITETIQYSYNVVGSGGESSPQTVTVTITGNNEAAQITGVETASLTEDSTSQLTATGKLDIDDEDTGEDFFTPAIHNGNQGSLTIDANGNWNYTADNSQSAIQALGDGETLNDVITVSAVDGTTHQITITITGTSDAAVISGSDMASLTEDSVNASNELVATGALAVSDTDLDEEFFVATDLNGLYGTLSLEEDGSWNYIADNSQTSIQQLDTGETLEDGFTITSADGTAHQIVITINGTNDAPLLTTTPIDQSIAEEQAFSYQIPANTFSDIEGDELTYSATLQNGDPLPAWLVFDAATRTFSGTPDDADLGSFNIRIIASDGTASTNADFSIDVTPTNDTPVVSAGIIKSTNEDTSLTLTEAQLLEHASDIDGDTLSISNLQVTSGNVTVADNGNQTWTITPAEHWSGAAQILFEISDGIETINNTLSLNVDAVADLPITIVNDGNNENYFVESAEDAPIPLNISVALADTDGSETLNVEMGLVPIGATVSDGVNTVVSDGSNFSIMGWDWENMVLTPPPNQEDDFSVYIFPVATEASNGSSVPYPYHIRIDIQPENDAAVIAGVDTGSVTEDDFSSYGPLGEQQLIADGTLTISDIDTSEEFVAETITGSYGELTINTAGQWEYIADSRSSTIQELGVTESLDDVITVQAADGTTHDITVTIQGANDQADAAPVYLGTLAEDNSLVINESSILNAVTDIDGDTLSVSSINLPGGGHAIVNNNDGTWTLTPAPDFNGLLEMQYVVSDGTVGYEVNNLVRVNITAVADTAVISGDDTAAVTEDSAATLTASGALSVTDPDAGEAGFNAETVSGVYGNLTIDADGNWNYSADNAQTSIQSLDDGDSISDTLTVQSIDGTTHSITITINGTDDAPVVGNIDLGSTDEDTDKVITEAQLLANASDIDGDELSITELSLDNPAHGTLVDNGDSTWTFSPASDLSVDDVAFSFTVSDGSTGDEASASAVLDITAEADAANVTFAYLSNPNTGNPIYNTSEDTAVDINFAAQLVDQDGSETLSVVMNDVPSGTTIGDGVNSELVSSGTVDITGWDLSSLSVLPPENSTNDFDLSLVVTSTEASGDTVDVNKTISIRIEGVNDSAIISGNDTGALTEEAAATLTASGSLSVSDEDVGESSFSAETISGSYGSLTIDASGNWFYSADNAQTAVQELGNSDSIADVITVSSADGTTHDIVITINGTNDAPTATGSSPSEMLTNGSFEVADGTSNANPVITGGDSAITLPGWDILGSVDLGDDSAFGNPNAYDWSTGDQFIDLLGNNSGANSFSTDVRLADQPGYTPSGLEQTVTTDPGTPYQLSFDYTGHVVEGQAAELYINGQLIEEIVFDSGSAFDRNTYTNTFVGTGSDVIRLVASVGANGGGLLVDNLSLKESDAHLINEDSSITLTEAQLLTNATDIDTNDALSASNVTIMSGSATAVDNGNGTWTITPAANWTGDGQISFHVSDGVETRAIQIDFAVMPGTDAALIGGQDSAVVTEDSAVSLMTSGTLTISDPDAGENSFNASTVNGTYGSLTIDADGNWTYSADNSQAAIQSLSDGDNLTDTITIQSVDGTSHTVDITINGINDTAVISGTDSGTITEDDAATLTVSGTLTITDADSGEANFTAETINGTYGSLSIDAAGNWTYSADNTQTAIQSLSDGDSLTDTITVQSMDGTTHNIAITIDGINDTAVISGTDSAAVTEDDAASLTTSGALTVTDADAGEAGFSPETVNGSYGSLTIDTAGNWTYSADNSQAVIQSLGSSDSLTDTLTVQSSDGTTHSVLITINGTNDTPVITSTTPSELLTNGSFEVADGTSNANPVITGGNAEITAPGWNIFGSIDLGDDSAFGNPNAYDWSAGDQFIDLLGNNSGANSYSSDLRLADQPGYISSGVEQTVSTDPGAAYQFTFDYTGHVVEGQAAELYINGEFVEEIVFDSGSAFDRNSYTHTFEGSGSDTIRLVASVGANGGGLLVDNLSLKESDAHLINEDSSLTITEAQLLVNASDVDSSDNLSVSNVVIGSGSATVTDHGNGTWTITPDANWAGDGTISFDVSDGTETVASQASFAVLPGTDAAIIGGQDSDSVTEDTSATLTVTGALTISDPDAGEAMFVAETVSGDYGSLTIDAAGGWTYSADNSQTSIDSLSDGDQLNDQLTVRSVDGTTHVVAITLEGTNDQPVLSSAIDNQSVNEDSTFSFTVPTDTFSDAEGDSLTYNATLADGSPLPVWLGFDANSRTFFGTPDNEDVGTLSLKVIATDPGNTSAEASFNLDISNTNDAPVQVYQESGGLLVFEAEHFHSSVSRSGEAWTTESKVGASGGDIVSTPDGSTPYQGSTEGNSAEITYEVQVDTPGTYYIWVKGYVDGGDDDSLHIGIDGQYLNTSDAITGFGSGGGWSTGTMSGGLAYIEITEAGRHQINLWVREDGFEADKIVLSTDSNFNPSGNGPAESDYLNAPVDQTGSQDSAFSYTVPEAAFVDVDAGDNLVWSATQSNGDPLPVWLSFDPDTRTFSGTPGNADVGSLALSIIASDGQASASTDITITIGNVNDAAVITGVDSGSVTEDDSVTLSITGKLDITDADIGESLFTASTEAGSYGSLTIDADGNWSYEADNSQTVIQQLKPADNLTETFSVSSVDGTSHVITVTINGSDDAPIAASVDLGATTEDASIVISEAQLLANSSDIDGDSLSITNVSMSDSAQGTLVDNSDGTWTFTPASNLAANDVALNFTVSDGSSGDEAIGTATIDVTAVADEAVVVFNNADGYPTVDETLFQDGYFSGSDLQGWSRDGSTSTRGFGGGVSYLTFQQGTTISKEVDTSNSDAQSYTFDVKAHIYGDLEVIWDGQVITTLNTTHQMYTGAFQDLSVDLPVPTSDSTTLELRYASGSGQQDWGAAIGLTEVVAEVFDTDNPIFNTNEDVAVAIDLSAQFTDQDASETMAVVISNIPAGTTLSDGLNSQEVSDGSLDISGWNLSSLSVLPPANSHDDFDLQLSVTTEEANGDTAIVNKTISVQVAATNDTPTDISLNSLNVSENSAGAVVGTLTTQDIDAGDTFSYTVSDNRFEVVGGQLKLKDGISLDLEAESSIAITVTSTDSAGESISENFTLSVSNTNDAPITSGDISETTAEDVSFTITEAELLAKASDADGDSLSVSNVGVDSGSITVTDNGNGTWTITPADNWSGSGQLSFDISDGQEAVSGQADITIDPTADAPVLSVSNSATISTMDFENDGLAPGWTSENAPEINQASVYGVTDASGGNGYIMDLDDSENSAATNEDAIRYTVDTSDGFDHEVTFNTRIRPDSQGTDEFEVVWNGTVLQTITPTSSWDSITISLPADGNASGQLEIRETSGAFDDYGALFDDVTISKLNSITFDENASATFEVAATLVDSDGSESITSVSVAGVPSGFVLDDGNNSVTSDGSDIDISSWDMNQLTLTPTANTNGIVSVTLSATATESSGGDAATTQQTIDFNIQNVADTAVISGVDTGTIQEDTAATLTASGTLNVSDADSGEASFTAETINGTYGSITIDASGNWTYSADNTQTPIQSLGDGEALTETLEVHSADGTTHDVVITINGTNDAPVLTTASPNELLSNGSFEVADGTSDANPVITGGNAEITAPGWDIFGSIDLGDDSAFGNPNAYDWSTGDQFIDLLGNNSGANGFSTDVRLADQPGYTSSGVEQTVSTDQGAAYQFSFDYTGHVVEGQAAELYINGEFVEEIVFDSGPAFERNSYTHTFEGSGSDTIRLVASVGANGGGLLVDNLSLKESDAHLIGEDSSITLTEAQLLANASDIDDSDTLSVNNVAIASGSATVVDNGNGTWTITPTANWTGDGHITFDVSDGTEAIASQASFAVMPGVDAAVIGGQDSASVTEDAAATLTTSGVLTISDQDAGESSFNASTVSGTYGSLTIDTAGNWNYSADNTQNAIQSLTDSESLTDVFTVSSVDGTTQNIVITINGMNDIATSSNQLHTVNEDGTYTFSESDFSFSDVDSSDSLQSITITQLPANGELTLSGSAVSANDTITAADISNLTFSPADNENGDAYASLQFTVSDGSASSVPHTVTFDVTAVNDPPTAPAPDIEQFDFVWGGDSMTEKTADTYTLPSGFTLGDAVWIHKSDHTFRKAVQVEISDNGDGTLNFKAVAAAYTTLTNWDSLSAAQKETFFESGSGNSQTVSTSNSESGYGIRDVAVHGGTPVTGFLDSVTGIDVHPFFAAENGVNGAVVGTVSSTDLDGDTLTFSLSNDAGGRFAIDSSTGEITVTDSSLLDFEGAGNHTITVEVSDGNLSSTRDYSIYIQDTNDAPELLSTLNDQTTAEEAAFSYTLPVSAFGDQDGDSITFSASLADGDPLPAVAEL